MSRGRATRAVAVAGALVLGGACRGGGAARPIAGAGEGTNVVIHAPRSGAPGGSAHVDERRWREVPAGGELELGPVLAPLDLDSVVVESLSDPGGLRARSCHLVSAAGGLADPSWLWGRTVTVTLVTPSGATTPTISGAGDTTVTGEVVELGEPLAIIDDGETRYRVPAASVHRDRADGPAADEAAWPDRPATPGETVYALDDDGGEVFGFFAAVIPSRLVLAVGAARERRTLDADAIARIAVAGVPAVPTLRCQVDGARRGRHLVRLAYATRSMAWRAAYQVTVGAAATGIDHVMLAPSFAITAGIAAPWPARVRLVLGLPSEPEPPVTVWEGDVTLGGGAVEVAGAPVRRRARLDLVYRGALPAEGDEDNSRYAGWRDASGSAVWRELALERLATDAPGPLRVGVRDLAPDAGVRWLDGELPALPADTPAAAVRVPLAVEPDLVGFRRKQGRDRDGGVIVDEIAFSVANRGATPHIVLVEEPLRDIARPQILYARLATPGATGELLADRWRTPVTVPGGALVQGEVVLQYSLARN